jgi:hypothetical protein
MNNKMVYNLVVPEKFEKKELPITMKVSESLRQTLESIGAKEDRPLGYVARELMVRGLSLYRMDGQLRTQPTQNHAPASNEPREMTYERFLEEIAVLKIDHIEFGEDVRNAPGEVLEQILEDVRAAMRDQLAEEVSKHGPYAQAPTATRARK